MRAAIIQSSYLPWKGYFDIIANVDLFVFLDDVQYTRNDWRNRNRFKFSGGVSWLTIPCGGGRHLRICDVALQDTAWQERHWNSIKQNYQKTPYFACYREFFEELYLERRWSSLSELNQFATKYVARELLGLTTEFRDSREFEPSGCKTNRLLSILTQVRPSVDVYVSGPTAQGYLREAEFAAAGMDVQYACYSGYPEYPQRFPPFRHDVSIVDLLFNVGPEAPRHIWGWRETDRSEWFASSSALTVGD